MTRLRSKEELYASLQSGQLVTHHFDYEHIKVHYPSMMDLLKWIKKIGANRLANGSRVGKDWLNRTDQYYQQHFSDRMGVQATLEIIWMEIENQ